MVSTPTRAGDLPAVPTPLDLGYKEDAATIVWYAVFMPAKTPRETSINSMPPRPSVLATPEMQAKLKRLAVDPMPMSPEQMDKFIASELAANERLIKAAGITPK